MDCPISPYSDVPKQYTAESVFGNNSVTTINPDSSSHETKNKYLE